VKQANTPRDGDIDLVPPNGEGFYVIQETGAPISRATFRSMLRAMFAELPREPIDQTTDDDEGEDGNTRKMDFERARIRLAVREAAARARAAEATAPWWRRLMWRLGF
jgi:hypothetical protein